MRGHSRPKDGVLSHAYDPRIHDGSKLACRWDVLSRSSWPGLSWWWHSFVMAGLDPAIHDFLAAMPW